MDGHYHDPGDRRFARNLRQGAPAEFGAFNEFNRTVMEREDGAVARKYRELIGIAVALTTQCVYCLESHTRAARQLGASDEEVAETVYVAAALRAGGAVAHGRLAMKLFERAGEEAQSAS